MTGVRRKGHGVTTDNKFLPPGNMKGHSKCHGDPAIRLCLSLTDIHNGLTSSHNLLTQGKNKCLPLDREKEFHQLVPYLAPTNQP